MRAVVSAVTKLRCHALDANAARLPRRRPPRAHCAARLPRPRDTLTGARPVRHLHVVQAYGASHRRAIGGGRAEIPAAPVRSLPPSLRPVIAPAAVMFAGRPVAAPHAPAPVTAAPSGGGDSSSTGLGLAALLSAGGAALLRLRHSAAAAGLAEGGTLAALAQSASVFWAGSCYPLGGTSASVSLTSSLGATAVPGAGATGGRAQFGVAGVVSNVSGAVGGRVAPAASSLVRAPGDDRTGLVVLLFAASAAIGAALGALVPGRREIRG